MNTHTPILVIGAGIGGLCTAITLQKQGFPVQIYEKVADLKGLGAGLILATNAMKALEAMGLAQHIQAHAQELNGFHLLDQSGKVLNAGIKGEELRRRYGYGSYAIHRAELHEALIELVQSGTLHTGKACQQISQEEEHVMVSFEDGTEANGACVIGADGIHSAVRKQQLPGVNLRYSGYTCWRGVIDSSKIEYDPSIASETWGKHGRFGIVPLVNDRIYWFATKNAPQDSKEMAQWTLVDLQKNFADYHTPITQILEHTQEEDLLWNDILDFKPLESYAFGRILLTGDAAHATTPNMGQGACMAIEDAAVLRKCLQVAESFPEAFKDFEILRIERARWIVNTSYRIGNMGQWSHGLLSKLRNRMMRMTPQSTTDRQLKKLFEVEF